MSNEDYQLDAMEDEAVKRSRNLKRGLAVAGGVVGLGGIGAAAAYAASQNDPNPTDETLTPDDILAGAEAGTEQESAPEAKESHPHKPTPKPVVDDNKEEALVDIKETAEVYDEEGNLLVRYDSGTIEGKEFVIIDNDGNGRGDILAYDENGDGKFQEHEIHQLDNQSYEIGKGVEQHVYQIDENGEKHLIYRGANLGQMANNQQQNQETWEFIDDPNNPENPEAEQEHIRNDFRIEKTGEDYRNDYAENNPDYQNDGGEQYAGMDYGRDESTWGSTAQEEYYHEETEDYGYHEDNSYDSFASNDHAAFDGGDDAFADA